MPRQAKCRAVIPQHRCAASASFHRTHAARRAAHHAAAQLRRLATACLAATGVMAGDSA
jgi:hypothetical protein